MIRAILFDLGGTLDGEQHWLKRFLTFYRRLGVDLPREKIRAAFDEAERHAAADKTMLDANLETMVRQHVRWQLAHLSLAQKSLEEDLSARFIASVRQVATENCALLSELRARGLRLGAVSNGCGNVEALCRDLGYAPLLEVMIDSRRLQLFKPDPAIFRHAAKAIGEAAENILMVGDSFARDVQPAKKIGMQTAWLNSASEECPDSALVDFELRALSDLRAAI